MGEQIQTLIPAQTALTKRVLNKKDSQWQFASHLLSLSIKYRYPFHKLSGKCSIFSVNLMMIFKSKFHRAGRQLVAHQMIFVLDIWISVMITCLGTQIPKRDMVQQCTTTHPQFSTRIKKVSFLMPSLNQDLMNKTLVFQFWINKTLTTPRQNVKPECFFDYF